MSNALQVIDSVFHKYTTKKELLQPYFDGSRFKFILMKCLSDNGVIFGSWGLNTKRKKRRKSQKCNAVRQRMHGFNYQGINIHQLHISKKKWFIKQSLYKFVNILFLLVIGVYDSFSYTFTWYLSQSAVMKNSAALFLTF